MCPVHTLRRGSFSRKDSHIRRSGAVALRLRTGVSTSPMIAWLGVHSCQRNSRVWLMLLLCMDGYSADARAKQQCWIIPVSAHSDKVSELVFLPSSGTRKMVSSALAKPGGIENGSIAVSMGSPKRTLYGPECRSNVSESAWRSSSRCRSARWPWSCCAWSCPKESQARVRRGDERGVHCVQSEGRQAEARSALRLRLHRLRFERFRRDLEEDLPRAVQHRFLHSQ